jgi:hypothetical protein
MHATHLHPRRALAAAMAVLALALTAIAFPARLGDAEWGLGRDDQTAASPTATVSGSPAAAANDPLPSPLAQLPTSVRWPPPR